MGQVPILKCKKGLFFLPPSPLALHLVLAQRSTKSPDTFVCIEDLCTPLFLPNKVVHRTLEK